MCVVVVLFYIRFSETKSKYVAQAGLDAPDSAILSSGVTRVSHKRIRINGCSGRHGVSGVCGEEGSMAQRSWKCVLGAWEVRGGWRAYEHSSSRWSR